MKKQITENDLALLIKKLNLDELDDSNLVTVEATKRDTADMMTGTDGWVRIRNQCIMVQDPVEGGNAPVISSISPVKLILNGSFVETEANVSSSDHIHWEIEENPLFEVTISEDRLHVYFHLRSKVRHAWRLLDTEPTNTIIVSAQPDHDIVLETVHLSHVIAELEQKTISAQLDIASIQRELESPTYRPVVIAKGKAAVPGKDAQLELYFSEQVESRFFEVGGSIDFRNHLQIPSAMRGEIIARKIPLIEGIPGIDVYGNIIIPEPPKDILIAVKPSVELTPDGAILALKEGRPRMTGGKVKTFDISTAYTVARDVDMETGNIVFSGDVIVYGNVTDGMIIESLGNVYVFGGVFNATITATGSIHTRENVIGSSLYSGYFGVMFNRLYQCAIHLSDQMEKLLKASRMLEQALEAKKQTVRFGQIVVLLIENKLRGIPTAIKDLLIVIGNIQHLKKEEYQKLKEMSELFLQPAQLLEMASYSLMQSYLALLQETHKEVARMQEEIVEIRINQCHNSMLKSNGDIVIHREGVLLSDLYSAGNIRFDHEYSVCRGSRLEAGGSITAQIIGGQTGADTVIKAAKQIKVRKMYSGRVCIGKYCTDVFDVVENKTFDLISIKKDGLKTSDGHN